MAVTSNASEVLRRVRQNSIPTVFPRSKVEIETQYAGSGDTVLKKPRVIESAFMLTAPDAAS
jgi:hypothetical protein